MARKRRKERKPPPPRQEPGSWRDPTSPRAGSLMTIAAAAATLGLLLLLPLPMPTRVTLALVVGFEAALGHRHVTEGPRRRDEPLRPWIMDAVTGAVAGVALSAAVTVVAALALGGPGLVSDAFALVAGPGVSWWWLQMRAEARRRYGRGH